MQRQQEKKKNHFQSTVHENIRSIKRLFGNASLELGEGYGKTIFQAFIINNMINFTFFEIKIPGFELYWEIRV